MQLQVHYTTLFYMSIHVLLLCITIIVFILAEASFDEKWRDIESQPWYVGNEKLLEF